MGSLIRARQPEYELAPNRIADNLQMYLKDRTPSARYSSFDYCFNYFRSYLDNGRLSDLAADSNLQLSCLQLGFYLASWGMLRNSALLNLSVKHYAGLIQTIATAPPELWNLDVDQYDKTTWRLVDEWRGKIAEALTFPKDKKPSDTLITKIMLGVFGCVPAFDDKFKKGSRLCTFCECAFLWIAEFYNKKENSPLIDRDQVHTLDFDTGRDTCWAYTRAKKIDMIFFIEGGGSPVEASRPEAASSNSHG